MPIDASLICLNLYHFSKADLRKWWLSRSLDFEAFGHNMLQPAKFNGIARDNLFSILGLESSSAKPALEDSLPKEESIPWQRDLLEMFLRNQQVLAPTMPLLAFVLSVTAMMWNSWPSVLCWLVGVVGCNFLQLYLCRLYFKRERTITEQREWIGMIAASELMQGVFWIVPLFFFWPEAASAQGTFLFAAVMAVCAVRFMVVNNFMPVLVAGTGIMTIGVALRCVTQHDPVYISLAGIFITVEVFFLFIARQLQSTARDMIIFRNQKDLLIAELHRARDGAEQEKQNAQKANLAKTAFLANMSHELRTPLNAILGFSDILQRELFGPITNNTYRGYAGDINNSGRYLLGLINDILDISRIEAGRREIYEEPVNLADPLGDAYHLLEINAAQKNIAVEMVLDPNLPKILGDERAIQQIAINAVKFTPRNGKVAMRAKRLTDGSVQMTVEDNGPGIPFEEQELALSAFTRGRSATTKAVEGAGLGLSIVRGIMELHGGKVSIQSASGQGTTIICVFPAKRVLSGPRSTLYAESDALSETQKRLIALTG
jgi:two-component system, cell cycle sensor histidine kinase PleC